MSIKTKTLCCALSMKPRIPDVLFASFCFDFPDFPCRKQIADYCTAAAAAVVASKTHCRDMMAFLKRASDWLSGRSRLCCWSRKCHRTQSLSTSRQYNAIVNSCIYTKERLDNEGTAPFTHPFCCHATMQPQLCSPALPRLCKFTLGMDETLNCLVKCFKLQWQGVVIATSPSLIL